MQMAEEAMAEVEGVGPVEVRQRLEQDPDALVVDVRDAADIPSTGLAARGINVSLGMLPVKADHELPEEWRDSRLQDRSRQVIVTCQTGENAARGGKLLKEMGFSNVSYMEGGMEAWIAAGLPTE
jgi:rhodanese-related sulfurtransferase